MKKILKRSLSLLLAITIIFSSAYVGLSEVDFDGLFAVKAMAARSGTSGDCTWSLDGTVLTISGNGEMEDYYSSLPWGTSITEVIIKDGVTSIGSHAFYDCTSLETITISDSVTSIGDGAFEYCTMIEKVYWNAKIVVDFNRSSNIFKNAGTGSQGIEFVFGDSVERIPNNLFWLSDSSYEPNIKSVTIPSSVKSIGSSAFSDCTKLESVYITDVAAWCSIDFENDFSNPVYYAKNLYIDGELVEDLVIPDGVKTVPVFAFSGTTLSSIIIPDSVTNIGRYAFSYCTSLTSIKIPDSVTNISDSAFSGCTNLTSITVPDSVTSIGGSAFSDCTNLGLVTIGDSVTSIGRYAFGNCTNLTSVIIGKGVTDIGDSAFRKCTNLASIRIPDSVKSIGESVFSGCTSLTSVIIGNNVTNIGSYAFDECMSLVSVIIPDSVIDIGRYAFRKCSSLASITIPDNVTKISGYTFYSCKNLKTVTIGNSSAYIGEYAFFSCENLTSISIPVNIKTIGGSAFSGCDNLRYVFYDGPESDWENITIGNFNEYLFIAKIHYNSVDHTYPNEWTIDIGATCTEDGSKSHHCIECNYRTDVTTIPATGHKSSEWLIDAHATAGALGRKHKECIDCGEVLETATMPQLKPITPKVSTTNEIGGVQVTWNKVAGATKYVVYRRQGGYNTWVNVGTTTGNTLLDKNVKSGIFYVYSVRAYNSAGKYSDFVSANTNTRKYMATPKLTTIYNHVNGLAIKWNAVAGITEGYRVYRRGAGSTYWTYLGTVKTTDFVDTSVKIRSGEYFRYTVIADGGYHSKFDTTGLYLKRLANPTLTSAVSSKSGITIKWEAVMGTTGYYVYRKTANSTWVRVAAVGGTNNTTFLDKTAKKGTTYTYTVRAVYGSTLSAYYSGISCIDKY